MSLCEYRICLKRIRSYHNISYCTPVFTDSIATFNVQYDTVVHNLHCIEDTVHCTYTVQLCRTIQILGIQTLFAVHDLVLYYMLHVVHCSNSNYSMYSCTLCTLLYRLLDLEYESERITTNI